MHDLPQQQKAASHVNLRDDVSMISGKPKHSPAKSQVSSASKKRGYQEFHGENGGIIWSRDAMAIKKLKYN